MKKIVLFFGLIIFNSSFSQENLRLNEKANIKITDWILNIPKDKSLENKYIVLEFWSSSCGPCLKAVGHLNELQKKFNREDLYFISLTDEKPDEVKKTAKKVSFKSIVVSDQRKYTYFWSNGIKNLVLPLTVLIDNNGIIKWIGMPSLLTESIITNLMENKLEPYSIYAKVKK
jgi:thiol-disulfide isomerase/thioredoxin